MREREFKVLGDELLDIRTTDILCLFDLDNAKNLLKKRKNVSKYTSYAHHMISMQRDHLRESS